MNTHESYVSIEVAKLLKQAGFDWKQYSFYNSKCILMNGAFAANWNDICYMDGGYGSKVSAPTLEVAQRWLREVKGYYISISRMPKCDYFDRYFTSIDIMKDDVDEELRDINGEQIYISAKTYEEALEPGIKKALKIILKEK